MPFVFCFSLLFLFVFFDYRKRQRRDVRPRKSVEKVLSVDKDKYEFPPCEIFTFKGSSVLIPLNGRLNGANSSVNS